MYVIKESVGRSWDNSVDTAKGYGLDGRGFDSRHSYIFFSTASDPNYYSVGTGGLFPRGLSKKCLKMTTHLHLLPRSRIVELYLHSLVLN
jgi:hypothetical protein